MIGIISVSVCNIRKIIPSLSSFRLSLNITTQTRQLTFRLSTATMHIFHLTRLPVVILISLLPCALANQQILTLYLPSNLPPVPSSSIALLVDTGFTRTAPLTRANTFVFRNLTRPGSYLLDIGCRDWDFAPMVAHVRDGAGIEVERRGGGELKRVEGGGWEARVVKPRHLWEDRGGCESCPYITIGGEVLWNGR